MGRGKIGEPNAVGHRGGYGNERRIGGGAVAQQPSERDRKEFSEPENPRETP